MFKRGALIGLCLVILSGCATNRPSDEEIGRQNFGPPLTAQKSEQLVRAYITSSLFDPDSLRLSCTPTQKGWARNKNTFPETFVVGNVTICSINAKNRFGGYVGDKNYVFLISQGVIIFALEDLPDKLGISLGRAFGIANLEGIISRVEEAREKAEEARVKNELPLCAAWFGMYIQVDSALANRGNDKSDGDFMLNVKSHPSGEYWIGMATELGNERMGNALKEVIPELRLITEVAAKKAASGAVVEVYKRVVPSVFAKTKEMCPKLMWDWIQSKSNPRDWLR